MISIILTTLPLFFLFNEALLAAEAKPSIAIIDRIQIVGNAKISGDELAKSLDIPLNREVFGPEMSEILMESERRLKASGKYKNDLTIKLVRSKKFPHFTIEAELQEVDRWYFGADGTYVTGPAFLAEAEESAFQYKRQSLGTQIYYGTRDYNDRGLALDFEWMTISSRLTGVNSTDSAPFNYNFKYNYLLSGLTASAIQKQFLTDYTYAGVITRTLGSRTWRKSEGRYEYSYDNMKYTTVFSESAGSDAIYATVEPVLGIRINKFLMGGKFSRSLSRTLKSNQNLFETSYINGVEQPSKPRDEDYNNQNNSFDNTAEFSFMWSDKSQLTVIEPGLDLHAAWSRRYIEDGKADPPKWLAHGEYTLLLSDQLASSILADGEWEYRQANEWQTSLKRIIDVGLRIDYVTVQQMIIFGEFYKVGGKRNEIRTPYDSNHFMLENRINAGLKYASPSLIYSLSLCYGSPFAGEYFFGNSSDSVYKRLGVR